MLWKKPKTKNQKQPAPYTHKKKNENNKKLTNKQKTNLWDAGQYIKEEQIAY